MAASSCPEKWNGTIAGPGSSSGPRLSPPSRRSSCRCFGTCSERTVDLLPLDEYELALPGREELAPRGGDQHILLQPDDPGPGRDAQFQGEDVARLDRRIGVAAVAR